MKWNNWVVLGLSVWLIISPWVAGFSEFNLPTMSSIATGGLIIVFVLWNCSSREN